jgi:hypothetical protein
MAPQMNKAPRKKNQVMFIAEGGSRSFAPNENSRLFRLTLPGFHFLVVRDRSPIKSTSFMGSNLRGVVTKSATWLDHSTSFAVGFVTERGLMNLLLVIFALATRNLL